MNLPSSLNQGLTSLANLVNSNGSNGNGANNGASNGDHYQVTTAAAKPEPASQTATIPMLPASLLVCQSCQKQYSDPCLLACFHSFCARCVRAHITPEKKVVCSICG